jgi:SH3-like domain-containing protein
LVSCKNNDEIDEPEYQPVDLIIEKTAIELTEGASGSIAIINGNKGYKIESSNQEIATAVIEEEEKIIVTAVKAGEAQLFLEDSAGKNVEIKVNVTTKILDLVLSETIVDIEEGETITIVIESGNGEYSAVSEKEEVATAIIDIDKIIVTAIKEGSTTIKVRDKANKEADIKVNVSPKIIELIVEKTDVEVEVSTIEKVAIISGNNEYVAISEDENIALAEIENDTIYISGINVGKTKIAISDRAGKRIEINVGVVQILLLPSQLIYYEEDADYKDKVIFVYDEQMRFKEIILYEIDANENETYIGKSILGYDSKGRINKFEKRIENSAPITHTFRYSRTTNSVKVTNSQTSSIYNTYFFDENGYLQTKETFYFAVLYGEIYEYTNNNITRVYGDGRVYTTTEYYEYGDKNGVYKNVNLPQWLFCMWQLNEWMSIENNRITARFVTPNVRSATTQPPTEFSLLTHSETNDTRSMPTGTYRYSYSFTFNEYDYPVKIVEEERNKRTPKFTNEFEYSFIKKE